MRSCFPLLALALPLCLPVALAQEEENGPVLPPVPKDSEAAPAAVRVPAGADFGEGLKQLAALGLPEMKEAQWSRAPKRGNEDYSAHYTSQYHFREVEVQLQGAYWKLAGDKGGQLDFGAVESSNPEGEEEEGGAGEAEEKSEPGLLKKMLNNYSAKHPPKEASKPAAPDVDADAKTLAEALGKDKVRKEIESRQEYSPSDVPGRCLIFAAQLHAAGKVEAANRVAAAVFSLPIDKEQIINGAVSEFADAAYAKAAKEFNAGHDWGKYRDAVKAALAKYPRGWARAGGVAMLLPLLEKRAAGTLPAPPTLPGVELKPEAVAALDQLLAKPSDTEGVVDDAALARSHGIDLSEIPAAQRGRILAMLRQRGMGEEDSDGSGLWLLDSPAKEAAKDPLARLMAMKMDGFIALAAVAGDDTLVISSGAEEFDPDSYVSHSSRHQSAEEAAQQAFDALDRPKTRGEVATTLLQSAMPTGEERSSGDLDPAAVAAAAVEFWKAHRGDNDIQLALLYLSQGDDSQKSSASEHLAKHGDPAAQAAFEKAVLDSGTPSQFAEHVTTYFEQRKAAARPFFEAYSKALKAELDGVDIAKMEYDRGNYAIREAGSVDKFIKTLGVKVGATSLKEIIEAATKSGETAEMQTLATALQSTPMNECLQMLAEPAAKAEPEMLTQILQVITQRAYQDRGRQRMQVNAEPKEKPSEELIKLWQPLMKRGEAVPEADPKGGYFATWTKGYGGKTCGDAVMLALELAVYPGSGEAFNTFADINGGSFLTVFPFVRSRVEAWTSGQTAPTWPDAKKVSEERKKEIGKQLADKPAGELSAFAQSLSLDERMAFTEIMLGYTEEEPAPAGVLELRTKVVGLRGYNAQIEHDPAILQQLGIGEGYVISAEKLTELVERLTREGKERSGTQVMFFRAPMGLGCIASARRLTDPKKMTPQDQRSPLPRSFQRYGDPEVLTMFNAMGYDFWSLKEGKVAKEEGSGGGSNSGTDRLKDYLAKKAGTIPIMTIHVLTREDAAKMIEKPQPEEEEE